MEKRNKKISGIVMMLLVLMMLISGSLAWQDVTQHKTNTFRTTSVQHNVVLVEDFKPKTDWKQGEAVSKKVSVRNGQETDDLDKVYDDAYVRLQFKEYMGIGKQEYKYSDKRLMIDKDGNFITAEKEEDLIALMPSYDVSADHTVGQYTNAATGEALWYIHTKAGDDNGQYGKFLITEETIGDEESITGGDVYVSDTSDAYHQGSKDKPEFTTHLWDKDGANYAKESEFTKYVSWDLGEVITMEDWVAGGKQPVEKWILDTNSNEGWAYWGQPLVHHEGTNKAGSISELILENVTLDHMPEGVANYLLHVNMDAVSKSDLNLWTDAPKDILDLHGAPDLVKIAKDALKLSIDKATALNAQAGTPGADALLSELTSAQAVYADDDASEQDVKDAKVALDAKIEAYLIAQKRAELQALITTADAKVEASYTTESYATLKTALDAGKTEHANSSATVNSLQTAINNLNTALSGLVLKPASVGDKVTFGGYNWTVLAEKEGKSLVMVYSLSKADLEGVPTVNNNGYIQYQSAAGNYGSYNASNLKLADDAFYAKLIKNDSSIANAVQAVKIEQEPFKGSGWNAQQDNPTVMDPSGEKTAFSLSVSDINEHGLSRDILKNSNRDYWLRSPGKEQNYAAIVTHTGALINSHVNGPNGAVRPALWVDLSQVTP